MAPPNMPFQRTRSRASLGRSRLNGGSLGGAARLAMILVVVAMPVLNTGPLFALAKQKEESKVVPPVLLKSVEPKLPKGAEAIPITLEARITASGDVENVKVLQSRKPELNEFYVAALKQYKYKPATLNGKPVPVLLTVSVTVHYR